MDFSEHKDLRPKFRRQRKLVTLQRKRLCIAISHYETVVSSMREEKPLADKTKKKVAKAGKPRHSLLAHTINAV